MSTTFSLEGTDYTIIPTDELQRLRQLAEDAKDIADATAIMERVSRGEEELVPAKFADRLIAGEQPVRVYRDMRGLTAAKLAEQAFLSAAYISEIESGKKTGSVEALKALATALNVTVDDLID